MREEEFLDDLLVKLDGLKCNITIYLERVNRIHKIVQLNYKKYTDIRIKDTICTNVIVSEKQLPLL